MTGIEYLEEERHNLSDAIFTELKKDGFELHHESGGNGRLLLQVVFINNVEAELPRQAFCRATGAEWISMYRKGAMDRIGYNPFFGNIIVE